MRTHRPIRPAVPEDDFLLDKQQVAKRLGIHPANVWKLCMRWKALRDGLRVTRVGSRPDGTRTDGVMKLLRSALIEHLHFELVAAMESPMSAHERERIVSMLGDRGAEFVARHEVKADGERVGAA